MSLVARLSKQDAVKFMIAGHLWVYRIHEQVKRLYNERLYGAAEEASTKLAKFPDLWCALRSHQAVCGSLMLYASLKYAFPGLLESIIEALIRKPANLPLAAHCYLVGRFISHPALYRRIVFYLIFANFSFRYLIRFVGQFDLSLVQFLIQSEESVVEYCQNVESRQYQDCVTGQRVTLLHKFNSLRKSSTSADVEPPSSQVEPFSPLEPANDLWRFHEFMSYRVIKQLDSPLERSDGCAEKATLYYYKLRPNRNIAARHRLCGQLARLSSSLALLLASLYVAFFAGMSLVALLDWHFAMTYPGCDPSVEANAKTGGYFSITINRYRLILFTFDMFESSSIWLDSGIGISLVFVLPVLIVSDLIIYWQSWHPQLQRVLEQAEAKFRDHYETYARQKSAQQGEWLRSLSVRGQLIYRAAAMTGKDAQLSHSINEIRAEMIDFFHQVAKADVFMSYILSFTYMVWLCGILVVGSGLLGVYSRNGMAGIPFPVLASILLFFFSVPISVFVCYTLRLYLSCNESYKLLFSLLVYLHPRQKLRLLQLAHFFTDERRHAFRFVNGTRTTPSSYVSMIGWTMTCVALVCSLE